MKKRISLLLVLALLVALFTGCQKADVYEPQVVSFAEQAASFKTYGRVSGGEKGVEIAWPASGVEFTLKCSGDVILNYSASTEGYLQICIDGVETQRPYFRTGVKSITVAEGLEQGEHTIRILQESDVSTGGGYTIFKDLEFVGVKNSVKPTAEKELFIEFVGDSITSGKGVLQEGGGYQAIDPCHSPTHAYAVRTAEALDADWSLVSRGGCGYFRVTSCPHTANEIYPYLNRFARNPVEYTFPRKADIVVIALGTNDGKELASEEEMRNAMKQLISQVRAAHGEATPVVLLYGMMATNWSDQFMEVATELENVYSLRVPRNNEGGNNHPNEAAMIVTAEKLTAFLLELVIPTLQK